jgi:uncharacterized protein|tara:strand:- start:190 stop:717 length:528 start_codon:yes stop_codon:yes gene_type:complete
VKSRVLNAFEINLARHDNGVHEFNFVLTPDFFECFDNNFVEEGKGKVSLLLDKSDSMMILKFDIAFSVLLTCDLSLEKYAECLSLQKQNIIKFGAKNEEVSDEVSVIEIGTQVLNVAELIYDFASLEIPMKKVHPDLRNEDRSELVYKDENHFNEADQKTKEIDPRWEILKKIKL